MNTPDINTAELIDIAICFIKNPTACPSDADAGSVLFPEDTFGDLLYRLDSNPKKAWEKVEKLLEALWNLES